MALRAGTWPFVQAASSGVAPYLSARLMSTPWSSKSRAASAWPFSHAIQSGVAPSCNRPASSLALAALTSASARFQHRTASSLGILASASANFSSHAGCQSVPASSFASASVNAAD